MEFGTGVVKITPAHDPNDFEVGKRHNLPVINVLTEDAKIVDDYPEYAGMDRYEARKKIVEDLEKGGFLAYVEDHEHNVGTCYRCGTTVEPRVSLQWFVKMDELAKPAIKAVEDGSIKFVPERFEKHYLNWMFALSAARKCVRTLIPSIHGSHQHCGRSQLSAGLTRQRSLSISIQQTLS